MDESSGGPRLLPPFLGQQTAALLCELPKETGDNQEMESKCVDNICGVVWRVLSRRLDSADNRVWEQDLLRITGLSDTNLRESLVELQKAHIVDWDDSGPYLYVRRAAVGDTEDTERRSAAEPSRQSTEISLKSEKSVPLPSVTAEDYRKIFDAIEWATQKCVNPLEQTRIERWIRTIGLKDVLDEIGFCREQGRGPVRYSQISYTLDKVCSNRTRIGPWGPLNGHGVVPNRSIQEVENRELGQPKAIPNAVAYQPVKQETVSAWLRANPDLYTDSPSLPVEEGRNSATSTSPYEQVPEEMVRRWMRGFPGLYDSFLMEYRRLAERASKKGPFRPRNPKIR